MRATCDVDYQERCITFKFQDAVTLHPGDTLTISLDDYVITTKAHHEVLMQYYDWKTEGGVIDKPVVTVEKPSRAAGEVKNAFWSAMLARWFFKSP